MCTWIQGLSVEPLLVYPTHYTGEQGYISDTEGTSIIDPPTLGSHSSIASSSRTSSGTSNKSEQKSKIKARICRPPERCTNDEL